ncbi:MAG TPA: DUF3106 domain-containing protein [Terriglobales bacterium]|nr:DUF3106 domain-containing protein [Terriglobales bacterium]
MIRRRAISVMLACVVLACSFAYAGSKGPHPSDPPRNQPRIQNVRPANPRVGEWLHQHKDLSPVEQQKALNHDSQFQKLSPEQKQQLQNRLTEFNKLPPEQKERVIQRMKEFDSLTPQQQQQARNLQGRLRDIPENRRKMMQLALRNLRQMDPQQREQVLNSERFKSMFNDNERSIMGGLAELPIGKGAQPEPETAQQPSQQNAEK